MRDAQSKLQATRTAEEAPRPFPPPRDFSSLSVADLIEAREAHHIQLASLDNVVATAIGRYLIHERDWYATHPPDEKRPPSVAKISEPRR